MEDPDFTKQNDRDSATRPLTDIPTKLLKQGFDVPPRQAAAYGTREDQLKGALVLTLHSSIVLSLGTSCGFQSTACWIRITSAFGCGRIGRQLQRVVRHRELPLPRPCRVDWGLVHRGQDLASWGASERTGGRQGAVRRGALEIPPCLRGRQHDDGKDPVQLSGLIELVDDCVSVVIEGLR